MPQTQEASATLLLSAPDVLAVVSLAGFGVLCGLIRSGRVGAADEAILRRLTWQRSPALARTLTVVSWPGFPPQSRVIPPLLLAALWWRGWRLEAGFGALAWGTGLLSTIAKRLVDRPRPPRSAMRADEVDLQGASFPAGHVMTYVGVYGYLAYCLQARGVAARVRRPAQLLLGGLVALVGPSRVHQGHHWPTDVLAAYLLSGSYLYAVTRLYRRVRG